jgi:hypothetical protein
MFERLEPTGSLSVVFKIECVDFEIAEEFAGDDIVASFSEVPTANEVPSAEVDTLCFFSMPSSIKPIMTHQCAYPQAPLRSSHYTT